MTNIDQIIHTAKSQQLIVCITIFIYFRRGVIRGVLKGLNIAAMAANINVVCYLIIFPALLYFLVHKHDMGLQGIWISRMITEFLIGSLYELCVYTCDVEAVIW